jgi:hypothetical protein
MDNDLQVPCRAGESKHPLCNSTETAAILKYGADFLVDLGPVVASSPKNGAFITSCICHSCGWSTLKTGDSGDSLTSYGHYAAWHTRIKRTRGAHSAAWPGDAANDDSRTIHIDKRGPNGGGALTDPLCMPFP